MNKNLENAEFIEVPTTEDSIEMGDIKFPNNCIKESKEKILNNTRVGNTFCYLWFNGVPKILIGPHWYFYVGLVSVMFIAVYIYMYYLWSGLNFYVKYSILFLYFTQLISYSLCALKNPGILLESITTNKEYPNSLIICDKCLLISHKKDKVQHCNTCNICVIDRDHHCPWTTKCVGAGNLYSFYIFVGSTFTFMLSLYLGAFSYFLGT